MKSAGRENLKLLVGMPEKTARGGINACEPPFLRALEEAGVTIREEIYTFDNDRQISIFQRVRQVWKTAFRFRRRLREEQFEVLHLNTSFETKAILRDAFALFCLKNKRTKVFLKFHGSDVRLLESANFAVGFLIRYLIKTADAVGLLSSEEKRGFIDSGFPEEKFFVVKNALTGFPQKSFPPVENFAAVSAASSAEKTFRLLFVSRLIATKGLLETIYAVSDVREKGFALILDVLGDGETRSPAEDLAKSLELGGTVRFHGHVTEERVRQFYLESDLLVFPTFHIEGFPMVVFNSLPFGLPIVTTRIRALADYLKEGENCLFCEAKNPSSVAEKIVELLHNEELRRRLSENNRILAKEFTAHKIAAEYLEIYLKLCG